MKKGIIIVIIGLLFGIHISRAQQSRDKKYALHCNTSDCLVKNKNKDAVVSGTFRKYTPNKKGKGANNMFWDWEILLSDSIAVPVKSTYTEINYKFFEGKKVNIKGVIFFGIIIGDKEGQNATGFRIDPVQIETTEK
jgi:hypothetical protein